MKMLNRLKEPKKSKMFIRYVPNQGPLKAYSAVGAYDGAQT